ncbi:uncharacterized protein LOC113371595 [Ctenocephalides felis]|uniref:uncharacterized protein LOC113371595 n=1 Tax=Ctenocephalides felis TaxID=7515 RepID=UPI000E6E2920|nr:uncharacterized protein LOC113371595 [Ctenocephalides felis]
MKIVLLTIGFLVAVVSSNTISLDESFESSFNDLKSLESRGALENKLLAAAEDLRKTLRKGGNLTNGEIMDPWFLENVDADIELPNIAKLNGALANVTVDGLSSFNINHIKVNVLFMKATFNITFDHLMAKGLYDIEGKLADLAKLFGKGSFDIMLRDINAAGHVKLWLKGLSTLEISEFNLVPSIGSMKFDVEGLMGNPVLGDMINALINDALPQVVEKHKVELSKEIEKLAKGLINPFLADMSLQDLLNLLGGGF